VSRREKRAVALVTFRIQRSGAVSRSSLEEPSGRADFDEAALRAIVDAQPFAPLPGRSFGGQFLTVNFQFAYRVSNRRRFVSRRTGRGGMGRMGTERGHDTCARNRGLVCAWMATRKAEAKPANPVSARSRK
jgi:TonB family protein